MGPSSLWKVQSNENSQDMINQLPDEILVDILSLVSIKELGRSSVLSKRWRNLWKSTTRLNFDGSEALTRVICSKTREIVLGPARSKYVTWVNEVLKLHERPYLDEFRVKFDLDASHSKDIDEWIKFALLKRAGKIEIDLTSYSFPRCDYTPSQECLHYLRSVSNLPNFVCIRSLSLCLVNVDGELVEYLLSVCPQLEMLSLSRCHDLWELIVTGPSLPLKYLKIYSCRRLESIELCAPKLETFVYHGGRLNFAFGTNPLLTELHIGGYYHFNKDVSDIPEVGKLRNLRHLVLDTVNEYRVSLVLLRRFIMEAASLSKLTLKLRVNYPGKIYFTQEPLIEPHKCLKELEVIGYNTGTPRIFELVEYLIKIAINLENVVLDPGLPSYWCSREARKQVKKVRHLGERLKPSLPPGAKLTVKSLNRYI